MANYYISLQTVVIRKSAVNKLDHSFDPKFDHISDFDLFIRLSKISKLIIVKEILAKWRVHLGSESWKKPEKFISEKKLFVEKLNKIEPDIYNKYKLEYKFFIRSINLRESVALIIKGQKEQARKILYKKLFTDLTMTCLYFSSFFSISRILLLTIIKLRRLNPE